MKKPTIKTLADIIAANNEAFTIMSQAEKRSVIAWDCLERIRLGQLLPEEGTLMRQDGSVDSSDSIKTVLETQPEFTCTVCAKGGLFMSYVGRVNRMSFKDSNRDGNNSDGVIHQKLTEIFTIEQLALIETAFEGVKCLSDVELPEKDVDKAVKFYERWDWKMDNADEKRLKAICRNIIRNKGTFIP